MANWNTQLFGEHLGETHKHQQGSSGAEYLNRDSLHHTLRVSIPSEDPPEYIGDTAVEPKQTIHPEDIQGGLE